LNDCLNPKPFNRSNQSIDRPTNPINAGTSTGIGRHAAEGLVNAGFLVFAGVRKPQDADPLVAAFGPERVVPLLLDVTDEEGVHRAVVQVEGTLAKRGVKLVRQGLI
jgi:NAD(P)-dependent dehydrogenase (short-subunit alcohol dehydrogenase family)